MSTVPYKNTNDIMIPSYELRELELFDDFTETCGDIYNQIFEEWCDKNELEF